MEVNRIAANPAPTPPTPPPPPPPPASAGNGSEVAVRASYVPAQPTAPSELPAPQMPERMERNERTEVSSVLRRVVNDINTTIETYGRHLSIRLHEATGRHIVTVYDSSTNEAIREIPPERVLDAHAGLLELAGLLVDARG